MRLLLLLKYCFLSLAYFHKDKTEFLMLSMCIGGISNLVSSDSDVITICHMSSSSYFKSINNSEISLSVCNNVSSLFPISSFNLSISCISYFAANLSCISFS